MTIAISNQLRADLEKLPSRMAHLAIDKRGYPVPFFVAWIDGEPEFRVADSEKMLRAVRERLCWVCGDKLGQYMTAVVGPMCGLNKTSAEPPSHLECARYSVRNCPFLSKPQMVRREDEFVDSIKDNVAGYAIKRNPGVTLLWTMKTYTLFSDGRGGRLFHLGEPTSVEWYALGKPATRVQVEESVRTGLPTLLEMAKLDGEAAIRELCYCKDNLEKLYPKD